jgi:uncharacterized protein DUF4255
VSDFRAVATVTKTLLQTAASEAVPGALVRTARPEAPPGGGVPPPGIDLYLYQVTPNAAFRGDDLPTRRSDGTLIQRPRAALDLHYLIVFRGNELELEPQRLLGNAVRALHGLGLLSRPLVHSVETDPANTFLAGSDLADAAELIKITPLPLSLEELSKLWSVFFQIPYNLSVAYQATVVAIEGDETPSRALPVAERRVYVLPIQGAVIDEAVSATGGPIVTGATLVLKGHNLRRPITRVSLRGVQVAPQSVSDSEVRVSLTVPPFPASGLRAGVQGVAVVHPVLMGKPEVEHAGFESNAAPLVLRPRVTSVTPGSGQVTVGVDPPLRQDQRAVLLLNTVGGSAGYQFANAMAGSEQASIPFDIPGVAAGQYLVRVQVDGADSPLVLDPASPDFGPTVTLP